MRRRTPRRLGEGIEAALAELAPRTTLAEIQRLWPLVVGERIAQAADPVAEGAGLLRVRCNSAVWANELELLAPAIVERLNERLPDGKISALRCDIGSAASAQGSRPKR